MTDNDNTPRRERPATLQCAGKGQPDARWYTRPSATNGATISGRWACFSNPTADESHSTQTDTVDE